VTGALHGPSPHLRSGRSLASLHHGRCSKARQPKVRWRIAGAIVNAAKV